MIGGLARAFDNLLGRGEAAVTVPPLDGALRPNQRLDAASDRLPLADVDDLAVVSGQLLASAGADVHVLDERRTWRQKIACDAQIACITTVGDDGLAIALVSGDIVLNGGKFAGRRYQLGSGLRSITAMTCVDTILYVAVGSAQNALGDWQRDLLQKGQSGSLWRIDLRNGNTGQIAGGLAYPAGLVVDGTSLVYAEAWRHRLVRVDLGVPHTTQVLYADLPGYPGRLAPAATGFWLAVFAPRSQLVEFVLREPAYCKRMIAEIPKPYWVAPKLRSGQSFYEPLQGGGVKRLGQLKPWAPAMSAGLGVKLDGAFQPRFSLHSRADGATHGVTSIVELQDKVFVAARGDGVVVALTRAEVDGGA